MCFYLSVYPHWRSMVTKQFIAPIQGSAAAADPLEGQVPLVVSGPETFKIEFLVKNDIE